MFIFFRLPCGFHPTSCNKDAKPENHATLSQQTDNMTHKHTERLPASVWRCNKVVPIPPSPSIRQIVGFCKHVKMSKTVYSRVFSDSHFYAF